MTLPIILLLSGVPGKVCREIASIVQEDVYKDRFKVAPVAFASEKHRGTELEIVPGVKVTAESVTYLESVLARKQFENLIVVDYSTPGVALDNVAAFAAAGVPFVMGTTGFDRAEAARLVKASSSSAVIAPNMAIPIVLLQSALAYLSREFPGAMNEYGLSVRESHQAAKKDVSGTAKSFVPMMEQLGMKLSSEGIQSIRDVEMQNKLGVPEEHVSGHGWHWYEAESGAGDVMLELSHRINGRRVYAEGTLRAVEFLAKKNEAGSKGEVFSMTDVLKQ